MLIVWPVPANGIRLSWISSLFGILNCLHAPIFTGISAVYITFGLVCVAFKPIFCDSVQMWTSMLSVKMFAALQACKQDSLTSRSPGDLIRICRPMSAITGLQAFFSGRFTCWPTCSIASAAVDCFDELGLWTGLVDRTRLVNLGRELANWWIGELGTMLVDWVGRMCSWTWLANGAGGLGWRTELRWRTALANWRALWSHTGKPLLALKSLNERLVWSSASEFIEFDDFK